MIHKKLILGVLLVAVVFASAPVAEAATSGAITVTVTIQNISVTVSGPIAFGTVTSGSITVGSDSSEVTNDGNANETYSLDVTDPGGWTSVQVATGVDEYALHAQFNSVQPSAVSFTYANHAMSTSSVASSGSKFAGDQSGLSVPASAVRYLWLKFEAPSSSTVFTQQSITVTVTAAAG